MIKTFSLLVTACALLISCAPKQATPDATYYLVRHAEKQLDVENPPLTTAGQTRANDLAARLADAPLKAIYSTDYIRTQETAAPTAKAKGLIVESFDPRDQQSFAAKLLTQKGDILVVGHSNTTPDLAKLLGADSGTPIVEATEYNRLYVIIRRGDVVTGDIQTFGK